MSYALTGAKMAGVARPGVLRGPLFDSVQPMYDYLTAVLLYGILVLVFTIWFVLKYNFWVLVLVLVLACWVLDTRLFNSYSFVAAVCCCAWWIGARRQMDGGLGLWPRNILWSLIFDLAHYRVHFSDEQRIHQVELKCKPLHRARPGLFYYRPRP